MSALPDNNYFGELDVEVTRQIIWLEHEISKELCKLRVSTSELEVMERNLRIFLKDYHKEVGTLFKQVKKVDKNSINDNSERSEDKISNSNSNDFDVHIVENSERDDAFEMQLKQLYRKLAKIFHPDVSSENQNEANRIFSVLKESYEQKDLSGLIAIEQMVIEKRNDDNERTVERLERLEQQYDSILRAHDRIKLRKHELLNSSSYKLHQRARWYKMCGDDLISHVKDKIVRQLEKRHSVMVGN